MIHDQELIDTFRLTVMVMISRIIVLLCLWFLLLAIYRLYFHPLAKYPGPFWAKVTDWYNVYHCYVGDRHLEFYKIHQKYGKFVRYGPNRVSVNSAMALEAIYSPKSNSRKSSHFAVFPRFFHSWSTQTMIDTETYFHSQKRRTIAQALHGNTTKNIENSVAKNTQLFCSMIPKNQEDEWSHPVNLSEAASYLSFDIMGEVCFGQSFGMMTSEDNRYILEVISEGARCLNTLGHMQKVLWTGIHKVLFRKLLAGLHRYRDCSRSQCTRRIKQGSSQTDVFDVLFSAQNSSTKKPLFSPIELQSETSLLIIAGSDTTATCLAATVFYLLHNARSLERAQQEVRDAFTTLPELESGTQLKSCHYLRACIDESLRMSPPVGGLMPRETLTGGMIVDGEHIPEGVEMGTPIYAIHHNEDYYPDPFKFNPDRWLEVSKSKSRKTSTAESAFCAFSVGSRNCVGKFFAYQEMMSVLARLLWMFEIKLAPGSGLGGGHDSLGEGRKRKDEFQLYDVFASKCAGPLVEFRGRDF